MGALAGLRLVKYERFCEAFEASVWRRGVAGGADLGGGEDGVEGGDGRGVVEGDLRRGRCSMLTRPPCSRSTRQRTPATTMPASRVASMAAMVEPPVVQTSSTMTTGAPGSEKAFDAAAGAVGLFGLADEEAVEKGGLFVGDVLGIEVEHFGRGRRPPMRRAEAVLETSGSAPMVRPPTARAAGKCRG